MTTTHTIRETRVSRTTLWRKTLLTHRLGLLPTWQRLFPVHAFETLRFRRYEPDTFERLCDRAKAQPVDDAKTKRLRRLLADDISLDRAWRELNAPENRATPQVTIEAIWHAVRERGLIALEEPATKERLSACDTAARAEIERRIARHFRPPK